MRKFLFIALLSFSASQAAFSQNLSTEGTDFWFGFMDNWLQDPNNPIILELYISADDSTSGVVEIPQSPNFDALEFEVVPGVTTRLTLPASIAETNSINMVDNTGIHLFTSKDVSVYAMNKRQYSADVAVILPTVSLGNEYIVMSHWENGNRNNNDNSDSEFLVVAISDNSKIRITPAVSIEGGNPAGVPFEITLNQGETYQIQARGDLTGTEVIGLDNGSGSCSNFALFAGNQYTKVGVCDHPDGHDHLYEQMYPVKTWGTDYTIVDFEGRIGGDVVKVLALQDSTSIMVGSEEYLVNSSEHLFLTLEGVSTIHSDKPVSVGQFSRSQGCDNTRGDPFFVMISPDQQLLRSITFNAPTIATVTDYSLNVVVPSLDVKNVLFDGLSISHLFNPVPGNADMSYARVVTSSGNHTLYSEIGFIAYVYGYGWNESFGYATGAGLSNLSLGIEITNQNGLMVPTDSLCLFDQVVFKPITNKKYDSYIYTFGDGNQQIQFNKDSVVYQYEKTGTYVFSLSGVIDNGNCGAGSVDTEVRVLKVINPQLKIRGPRSVCPNTYGVTYFVENNFYYDNEWFISGGNIVSMSKDSIVVDWYETNNKARVSLVSHNRYECYGDTVTLPVRINIQLEPEAPFGADSLCESEIFDQEYYTYETQGSAYTWYAEHGDIVSGQGTSSIRVDWQGPGKGRLWFYQLSQTDTICDGVSDTLEVYIQRKPDPKVNLLTNKTTYKIEETIYVEFTADSLMDLVSMAVNGQVHEDSIPIHSAMELSFSCPGIYHLEVQAIDTLGICLDKAFGSKQITVMAPELEIINVTHDQVQDSTLHVNWQLQNVEFSKSEYLLQLFLGEWRTVDTLNSSQGSYTNNGLSTSANSYEFRLFNTNTCEQEFSSRVHQSILLRLEEEHTLQWNEYQGWSGGVQEYIIERNVDDHGWREIDRSSFPNYAYENDTVGFDHCFRIIALEQDGNKSYAYSNVTCDFYEPELYAYNVITPNQDNKNENFIITNVELYPHGRLQIFNRWGAKVYETIGYKNDWSGKANGQTLANGVYYYVFELNEPRVGLEKISGQISILR